MACPFEEETDCCARCGASFAKYARAGYTCRAHDGDVVHLDRAMALRHRDRLAPLLETLRADAARLIRGRPAPALDDVFDLYAAAAAPGRAEAGTGPGD